MIPLGLKISKQLTLQSRIVLGINVHSITKYKDIENYEQRKKAKLRKFYTFITRSFTWIHF